MEFYDRRTGELVHFPKPEGMREVRSGGEVSDLTDPWDSAATPDAGDHIARPELLQNPKYLKMMNKLDYVLKKNK